MPKTYSMGLGVDPTGDLSKPKYCNTIYDVQEVREAEGGFKASTYERVFTTLKAYQEEQAETVGLKGRYGLFSGSFNATFSKSVESLATHSAALYRATYQKSLDFDRGKTAKFPDFVNAAAHLPTDCTGDNYNKFADFFRTFGAFLITGATVGGSLDYAVQMDHSETTDKSQIMLKVKAEYGAVFTAAATAEQDKQIRKVRDNRVVKLTVKGGDYTILPSDVSSESTNAPHAARFQRWVGSIPNTPDRLSFSLTLITDAFSTEGEGAAARRIAALAALERYLPESAQVEASWERSTINLSGTKFPAPAAPAGATPRIRIATADPVTLTCSDQYLEAGENPDNAFWHKVKAKIDEAPTGMLLLATEYWPKTRPYFPNSEVEQALLGCGANSETLRRWKDATNDAIPSHHAGISYALIRGGNEADAGTDAFAAGFGERGKNTLTPTVSLDAVLQRDELTRRANILHSSLTEDSKTENLITIQHAFGTTTGALRFLAAGPNSTAVTNKENPKDPRQFWWRLPRPGKYLGLDAFWLINFQTAACLLGHAPEPGQQVTLGPISSREDMLWDLQSWGQWDQFRLIYYRQLDYYLSSSNTGATDDLDKAVVTLGRDPSVALQFWRKNEQARIGANPLPRRLAAATGE